MRIRYYGLFANRYKKQRIQKCRMILGLSAALPKVIEKSFQQMMLYLTGTDITKCPICKKGTMRRILKIPEGTGLNGYHYIHCAGKSVPSGWVISILSWFFASSAGNRIAMAFSRYFMGF